MNEPLIIITQAIPLSLDEILSLLQVVNLPSEGVTEYLPSFLVAKTYTGKIVGCVGLEQHGQLGLLRSAAVHPDYQGAKIGTRLVFSLLSEAREKSISEVLLLTTSAQEFFAKNFGFQEAKRWRYNQRLQHSPEWNLPPCSSAVLMKLKLQRAK
ncbi:MAG: GNAT family N-acetyltransferase [Acidobacteria bacterium]|nr:GNAT family N-acetyltransferase [Acidobacteriota bacterium]